MMLFDIYLAWEIAAGVSISDFRCSAVVNVGDTSICISG